MPSEHKRDGTYYKTANGRKRPGPRFSPTYGTAAQRRERKRREAEERNARTLPENRRQARLKREAEDGKTA